MIRLATEGDIPHSLLMQRLLVRPSLVIDILNSLRGETITPNTWRFVSLDGIPGFYLLASDPTLSEKGIRTAVINAGMDKMASKTAAGFILKTSARPPHDLYLRTGWEDIAMTFRGQRKFWVTYFPLN